MDHIREEKSVKDRKSEFISEAYGIRKEAAVRSILMSALQQPCQLVYAEGCEPNVSNVIYTTGSILTPFFFFKQKDSERSLALNAVRPSGKTAVTITSPEGYAEYEA